MSFIEVRQLRRIYRTVESGEIASQQIIFNGLDLDVEEGEFAAIVGPSGCGKSTLLNMVGGLDSAHKRVTQRLEDGKETSLIEGSGSITVGDFPISSSRGDALADFLNRSVGFVFQFHHLIPELTALENVALPRLIRQESKTWAFEAARQMLGRVGLADGARKLPSVLSGGEKQRVAIARALINRPRLLLADEPTGSLDPSRKSNVFNLLRGLNLEEGITVVLVTHDVGLLTQEEGESTVDRVIRLGQPQDKESQ